MWTYSRSMLQSRKKHRTSLSIGLLISSWTSEQTCNNANWYRTVCQSTKWMIHQSFDRKRNQLESSPLCIPWFNVLSKYVIMPACKCANKNHYIHYNTLHCFDTNKFNASYFMETGTTFWNGLTYFRISILRRFSLITMRLSRIEG